MKINNEANNASVKSNKKCLFIVALHNFLKRSKQHRRS